MIDIICKILLIICGTGLSFILLMWIAVILITVHDYWEDIINYFRK